MYHVPRERDGNARMELVLGKVDVAAEAGELIAELHLVALPRKGDVVLSAKGPHVPQGGLEAVPGVLAHSGSGGGQSHN